MGPARSSSFPGLPEAAAIPSSPAEALLSAPSPRCVLYGVAAWRASFLGLDHAVKQDV